MSVPDGDAFVGAIFNPTWHEYVGACLESPLKAGVAQTLEMFVRIPPSGGYSLTIPGDVDVFCESGAVCRCSEAGLARSPFLRGRCDGARCPISPMDPSLAHPSPGIDHCNLPISTYTTLKGSYELLATARPAKSPIQPSDDWQTISLQFTPTKDCPAIIFGPSDTNVNPNNQHTYMFFDALNLQQGQGTCNNEGLCIPN